MESIIDAQGRQQQQFEPGVLVREVVAESAGTVIGIDNYQMARIARMAGAPMDKGAGVDLLRKLGDTVEQGEPLYRVHASFPADFRFAGNLVDSNNGYRIGDQDEVPRVFVEF